MKALERGEHRSPGPYGAELAIKALGVALRCPGVFASVTDRSGVYRWVCDGFIDVLGFTGTSPVGRSFSEVFSEGWAQDRLEVTRTALEAGLPIPTLAIFRGRRVESVAIPVVSDGEEGVLWLSRFTNPRRAPGQDGHNSAVLLTHPNWGPLGTLTRRELEVLRLLSQGLSNDETARAIFRTKRTVEWHIKKLYEKLRCETKFDLVRFGLEAGLDTIDDAEWITLLERAPLEAESEAIEDSKGD